MVILAMVLMGYWFFKQKMYRDLQQKLYYTDFLIVGLAVLYLLSYLREPSAKNQILKTESAFLVYFLGRIMGSSFAGIFKPWSQRTDAEQICRKLLCFGSYLVVELNFWYKLYVQMTWKLKKVYVGRPEFNIHSDGALYYYKTDLAIGITVALLFIYILGKDTFTKWVTIIPIGIFMLFYETQAKSGQIILILEYILMFAIELSKWLSGRGEKKKKAPDNFFARFFRARAGAGSASGMKKSRHKKRATGYHGKSSEFDRPRFGFDFGLKPRTIQVISGIVLVALTAFFVFISVYPPLKIRLEDLGLEKEQMKALERVFHSRHLIWWDAISYYVQQPFGTRLIGIDLVSETLHNSLGDRFHNLYFKQIYSIGYLGCYLYTALLLFMLRAVTDIRNRNIEIKYFTLAFWIMFIIMGISMEGLEYTQMSWYPFIFLGIIISTGNYRIQRKERTEKQGREASQ